MGGAAADHRDDPPPPGCRALVLAGSRRPDDPVARRGGVRHKALVQAGGVPMLARVLGALRESRSVGEIAVAVAEDFDAGEGGPELAGLLRGGAIETVAGGATPASTVTAAPGARWGRPPLLVATADHPLLTAAMIDHFCAAAPPDADLVAAVVDLNAVRRAYPGAARTRWRFAGGRSYGGGNLFLLRTPAAARVVGFWAGLERHRKRPWRLVAAVGPPLLARFLLGRLSLDAALAELSRRAGATVRAVELPFPEAAIDVDQPADLDLVEAILRRRDAAALRPPRPSAPRPP